MDTLLPFVLGSIKALVLLALASGITLALRRRAARVRAVVWGTALGLQKDIEGVLSRSLEDVQDGRTTTAGTVPYFPVWWQNSSGTPFASAGLSGSGGGLFSDSGIPNVGGMMAALGTIGNSPPSSGGGGGGFGGGGSGGGGGGAGGGF